MIDGKWQMENFCLWQNLTRPIICAILLFVIRYCLVLKLEQYRFYLVMKKLFAYLLVASCYLLVAVPAQAQCTPVYGGGVTCSAIAVSINKTVANPQTAVFVDNLGVNDPKFAVEQIVNFRLAVTNTTNQSIGRVMVKDIFPQFVSFVSGPGSFDANSKTLSFEVANLNANETRTFDVQGKTAAENQLPASAGIVCVTNQATATLDDGRLTQDNSQLCVEKKVIGAQVVVTKGGVVTQIPSTGPELYSLLILVPSALLGAVLRKKAIGRQ